MQAVNAQNTTKVINRKPIIAIFLISVGNDETDDVVDDNELVDRHIKKFQVENSDTPLLKPCTPSLVTVLRKEHSDWRYRNASCS